VTKYLIRIYIGFILLLTVPAGFFLKSYSGPGQWWFNDYGAGVLYEVFWILVVFFFSPRKKMLNKAPLWVFTVTCALEVLQLWHPSILERIRSYYLGAVLIGTTFSWFDFPHYAFGCIIGYWLIRSLANP